MQLDRESLDTYLNDHLAASIAALQLIGRICSTQDGTPTRRPHDAPSG